MSDAYDPTAPEGEVTSRGQYMTKRDAKIIGIALLVFAVLALPTYHFLLGYTDSSRCIQNMHYISEALSFYETEHDGKLPPIDRTETPNDLTPDLSDNAKVYSWTSDLAGYMNARGSFACPAAQKEENVLTEDPRGPDRSFMTSYGMYAPYGAYLGSLIESPDQTILVGETSNLGTQNTLDPVHFKTTDGAVAPDGFVIGWNDSNDNPGADANAVSRLSFPDTASGKFVKDGGGRHGGIIHVLSASGQLMTVLPPDAIFRKGRRVNPMWTVPPITH